LKLTTSTQARIRYANLTGDRYLDLTPGSTRGARTLAAGATIPESRTHPALELDDLFAGFDPLMQALSPDDVNELTTNIIGVTEGQAGAVKSMLANVGSFTSGLADRDQLIGSVIDELSRTLKTIGDRRDEFDHVITGLASLTSKLADDRKAFTQSLADMTSLATDIADFLTAVRPGLKANIDELAVAATNINRQEPYVREVLGATKQALNKVGRLGGQGSFFNFFLCGVRVKFNVPGMPDGVNSPSVYATDERCKDGVN
jgi:phospholipid/cholesterol/gamma-HCH transport system substrate-binding protein